MRLGTHTTGGKEKDYHIDTDQKSTLIIGQTQTGKTTLLTNAALDEIHAEKAVAFIDTNGTGFDALLARIPKERQEKITVFDASDYKNPFLLNVLNGIPEADHSYLISTLLFNLKGHWGLADLATANINQYFRAATGSLLKNQHATLLHALPLLLSAHARTELTNSKDADVFRWFWTIFENKEAKDQYGETASTINKLWELMFEPTIRHLLVSSSNHLSFKDRVVLVNLPVQKIGADNARFIAALVLTQLMLDAREGGTEAYIDDCHLVGPTVLERLLATFPGYGCSITVTLSYLDQLENQHQIKSILGGVNNIVPLRCSPVDAHILEPRFDRPKSIESFSTTPRNTAVAGRGSHIKHVELDDLEEEQDEEIRERILRINRADRTIPLPKAANRFLKFCKHAMELTAPPKPRKKKRKRV